MKNKSLTYVLLIVVAIVWYNVFFRVVSNFSGDDSGIVPTSNIPQTIGSIDRDTFSLNANYRDPFGSTTLAISLPVDPQFNPNPYPVAKPIPQKVKDFWPKIEYKGMLRKTSSDNPLAIIFIDDIQLFLRKGEQVFDGITLKTVHRDSVVILYKKEKRVYWRD